MKDSIKQQKIEPDNNDFGNNLGWSYNWEGEMDGESDIGEAETNTIVDWENVGIPHKKFSPKIKTVGEKLRM